LTVIESLETELNDAKEEIRNLKALLNQNSKNSSKHSSSGVFVMRNLKLKVTAQVAAKNLVVRKIILEKLLK